MTPECQEIRTKAEVAARVAMRPVAVRRVLDCVAHGSGTPETLYEIQVASGQRFIVPYVDKETIFNPSKFL